MSKEKNKESKGNSEAPELQPEDMFKLFYMLLRTVGGRMAARREVLGKIPDDETLMSTAYDEKSDSWVILANKLKAEKKRKRGIIKKRILSPPRKLFLPN